MSLADHLVDRRKLRRTVTMWRVLAFVAAGLAVVAVATSMGGRGFMRGSGPHIARIAIEGVITGDKDTISLLDDVAASDASALILTLESPGGTTTGSEKVYDAIRRVAAKKPVVGVVGNLAASGAYIAALGTDRIFASGNSLVGSIGVLFQYPNFAKLLDTVGVKMEEVKSSPLKASPNGFEPTSPDARAALAALVTDSYDWFKALVKDRRHMSDDELKTVADGRVFTGRQAIGNKLIDAMGGEKEAIAWLESEKGIAKALPVRDWKKAPGLERLGLLGSASSLARLLGFESLGNTLQQQADLSESRSVGGLMSLWQIQ